MLARTLMVQGTASSVGKSLLVAALCRWFAREGLRVAPFKAQNMALNSAVTADGLEIGRAQAVQAEAAGIAAHVDMNPILLKPEGEKRCQVVLLGAPLGSLEAREYHAYKTRFGSVVAGALERLRARYDLVVIEGAGSPAEINLKDRDLVNMHVAELADANVLLAGDIDRGGVFAAFVGTLELLEPHERARVAAFIVNKFRGDLALLEPGLRWLEARTGKPVLGVVPYLRELGIADEDSVALETRVSRRRAEPHEVEIAVVQLPLISNYDDFAALEREPGVVVRFVSAARELAGADLVIVPGSKSTVRDLFWLRERGIAAEISTRAARGEPVLGVCGGCQMLGTYIVDDTHVESTHTSTEALGLLPFCTRFYPDKITAQVRARSVAPSFLNGGSETLSGYEIHMGRLEPAPEARAAFQIVERSGDRVQLEDGAVSDDGAAVGTMLHGLFDNDSLRASMLGRLRERRGIATQSVQSFASHKTAEFDRLEGAVRASLDRELLWRLAGLS